MKLVRLLCVLLILCIGGPALASQINRNSGLGLGRTGPNTARGTVTPSGGTFGELLNRPANLNGGQTEFGRLLEMPFKLPDLPPDKGTVKGVLTPANIGKALRGGVGGYLAGEAFKTLAEAACVRLMGGSMQLTPSGAWEECVPGSVQPSTGTDYQYKSPITGRAGPWSSTKSAGCLAISDIYAEDVTRFGWQGKTLFEEDKCWLYVKTNPNGSFFRNGETAPAIRNATCPAGQYQWSDGTCHSEPNVSDIAWRPITTDQAQAKLEDVIKNPANASKVWDAMRDYAEKGGNFDMDQPLSVEGPAQSPASTTTSQSTQQTPNGPQTLTTTNTTVINYNYAGDTITVNQTTTSVTRNEAGDVISSTTTNSTPEAVDEPPSDTPLPPVPDLYVRKYPNGMEGIYDEYKDQLKNTSLVQLAKQLMPNIGDGGACPSWPINLNFATWAPYGVHDVAPPCWIWDVAKAILILSALLLARALIFGG
ncbi:hypothetical protein J2738_003288 [Variovorax paradoxus]|uniref:Uncharacterized protein n=1 Tax=Variovorax paradoxus TaxID=34073 RepID=A0AAE3XYP3_VARPD|nr:hypothetical protein [Variovorax paradoxus]MDR6427150.1 hypothetical protein [Variovorax paradoxus]